MWDEEIEKAMLYYIIFEKEDYLLDEEDFVNERNKKIIKAINELKAEKQEVLMMSIKSKIKAVDLSNLTQEEYGLLMKKKITLEELIEKGKVNVG